MSSVPVAPNASYPPDAVPNPEIAASMPPAPDAPHPVQTDLPRLPYTDDQGNTGTVDMGAVRDLQDKQAAEAQAAQDIKDRHTQAAAILASPLNDKAKHEALAKIYGPTPEMGSDAGKTPIDSETAAGVNNFAVDQYNDNVANSSAVAKEREGVARQEGALNNAEIKARAPLDAKYAEFARGQFEGLQQLEAAQAQKTQEVISRYQQTNADMHAMAIEKPQDIFGQSGTNGILGRISIFLGGAGSNGEHENRNLAYIQDLANRNIARQERNWNHLQAVGHSDETLYGQIRNQTQDAVATANVMNNMYLSAYGAQLKSMSNQYADKRTQLAVNKQLSEIHSQKMLLDDQFAQHAIGTMQKNLAISGSQAAATAGLQFKYAQAAHKEETRQQEQGLPGFDGIATKDRHADLSKFQSGGKSIVDGLDEIQKILTMHQGSRFDRARAISVLRAIIQGNARQFFETGTRLEGPEIKQMETVSTSYMEGLLKILEGGGNDVTNMIGKLNATKHEVRRAVATKILGGQKNLTLNKEDPFWAGDDPLAGPQIGDESDGSIGSHAQEILRGLPNIGSGGAGGQFGGF
jgi:hypothetical protein